jgi:hypothetical protein
VVNETWKREAVERAAEASLHLFAKVLYAPTNDTHQIKVANETRKREAAERAAEASLHLFAKVLYAPTNDIHQIKVANERRKREAAERKAEVEKQKCIAMEKQLRLYGIDSLGSMLASGMWPIIFNFTSTVSRSISQLDHLIFS